MRKLTIVTATGLIALVTVLATTDFGRSVGPRSVRVSDGTGIAMVPIEQITFTAENLPVQYFDAF